MAAKKRPVAHAPSRRHAVAHRPGAARHRPLLRKVTYASPLCADRAPIINALLGDLPAPLFQPIAAPAIPAGAPSPVPVTETAIQRVPVAPEPIIPSILPPRVPLVPSVPASDTTPPVEPAPEPASWMTMLLGFGVIGWTMRRSRPRKRRRGA